MWLAEVDDSAVGMINMMVFARMPRPGRVRSTWGYVANVFVLAGHRDAGIGARLLDACTSYADDHGFVRLVLSPSERSVPLYERFGFSPATSLLLRPGPDRADD
jgi:GNAT superfamily N-acetyltransferase